MDKYREKPSAKLILCFISYYICYFFAFSQWYLMVFMTLLLETSEKKAQEQDSKLKICADGRGYGRAMVILIARNLKPAVRGSWQSVPFKWESGGVAPGIPACGDKWKGASYWLDEHKVLAFSSTSWGKSFNSSTSMFYVVTLNCLLLEFIFYVLVYDSLKKEASIALKCFQKPPSPAHGKNLNF